MLKITIENELETENGWEFLVQVNESGDIAEYDVFLSRVYWQEITGENEIPSMLVERSFRFLLSREPKEAILKKFKIKEISNYFSDYEKKIKNDKDFH